MKKIEENSLDGRVTLESDQWESVRDKGFFLPIDERAIPHFVGWVNFNRFASDHKGLDLAAYVNKFGEAVLGLPPRIGVYAVADGKVLAIERRKVMSGVVDPHDHYFDTVVIAHGRSSVERTRPSLLGIYAHMTPTVKEGQYVSKGQKIGKLYADLGTFNRGRLVHLHFALARCNDELDYEKLNYENPEILFPDLMKLTTSPQREPQFEIVGQEGRTNLRLANFPVLQYGETVLGVKPADEFRAQPPTYSLIERVRERLQI